MKISTTAWGTSAVAVLCAFAIAVVLSGCEKQPAEKGPSPQKSDSAAKSAGETRPKSEKKPSPAESRKTPKPEQPLGNDLFEIGKQPRDLGPPLVDNPENLVRLHKQQPIWIDPYNKQVVLLGEVCDTKIALEFFATFANRAYEAVLAVDTTPSFVHTALLAVGAEPGHPAQFQRKEVPGKGEEEIIIPASGTEIAIEVRWKDRQDKRHSAPAQHWIRDVKTKKELDVNWVFAGSAFLTNPQTGKIYYQANSGELINLVSSPIAMIDLPTVAYKALDARSFEAFKEHLPPPGTPTTILLKPILAAPTPAANTAERKSPPRDEKQAEAERKAVEAAGPWLELIDKDEYTRAWEIAAEQLKNSNPRREFIKLLSGFRKPLGKVTSRKLLSKQYNPSLPDAAEGQFVVLKYASTFEKKPSAVEMLTLTLDKDNKWRVSEYAVR